MKQAEIFLELTKDQFEKLSTLAKLHISFVARDGEMILKDDCPRCQEILHVVTSD